MNTKGKACHPWWLWIFVESGCNSILDKIVHVYIPNKIPLNALWKLSWFS